MFWTRTRVSPVDEDAHGRPSGADAAVVAPVARPPMRRAGQRHHFLGRLGHRLGRAPRSVPSRIARPSAAFVPTSRATTGTVTSPAAIASTTAWATTSQRVMPPKMFTSTARTYGIVEKDAQRRPHLVDVGAPADVQEVRRLSSVQLDDVHGGHGQTRPR